MPKDLHFPLWLSDNIIMEKQTDISIPHLLYGLWCDETFTRSEIARLMEVPDDSHLLDILGDLAAQRLIYVFYHPSPTRYRISPKGKELVLAHIRNRKR